MRNTLLCILTGVTFLTLATVAFAEGPAVSAVNGKVSGQYGNVDSDDAWTGDASLTLPLSDFAGLQIDGSYGEVDADSGETLDFKGIGAHLFHRDPESYLVGLIGVDSETEDVEVSLYGAEAEAYIGPVTLAAVAGGITGDVDDSGFGSADVRWYPIENIMVEAGGSVSDEDDRAHIGAEFQVVNGVSLFVDAATGNDGYDHVFAGLRCYVGEEKSLIDRHRQDDPNFSPSRLVLSSLSGISEAGSGEVFPECPEGQVYVPEAGRCATPCIDCAARD